MKTTFDRDWDVSPYPTLSSANILVQQRNGDGNGFSLLLAITRTELQEKGEGIIFTNPFFSVPSGKQD
jgi:hypothetical protein